MSKIKITLVDDHALFRNGLKILLNTNSKFDIINESVNGKNFIDSLDADNLPDIVLMDINMPIMDGIDATEYIHKKYPDIKVIALSMFGEEEYYYKMINAGAKGFLLKNSDINEVIEAINQVMVGESYFSQELLYNVIKKFKPQKEVEDEFANLSKRELQVLNEICNGYSNQEIADALFISKRTVDKHRANLLSKTNSKNTANLIMYAVKNKLISV
jgi:DNA-binding NarL/FixJ family response regulator